MKNLEKFKQVYTEKLKEIRTKKPDYYLWPIEDLPLVTKRMLTAIEQGNFNKDSLAFKHTCKELGIKHTYKAIKEFTKGGE